MTAKEAEAAGFRRTYKWTGNRNKNLTAPPENPVKESAAPEMDNLPPKQRRNSKKNKNPPPKQGIFTRSSGYFTLKGSCLLFKTSTFPI